MNGLLTTPRSFVLAWRRIRMGEGSAPLVCLLLGLLLCAGPVSAAVILGAEARVPYPPSAKYNLIISDKPRDGEAVSVNPPVFAWSYSPNPTNTDRDVTPRLFQFQIAYEPTFANPVVNVRTKVNTYNFLAPLTNNLYPSNIIFWRVLYITTNNITMMPNSALVVSAPFNVAVTNFGPIRSFVIPPGTPEWDRSALADPAYLAAKAQHPHMLFNNETKPALSNWLVSNLSANVRPGWQQTLTLAYQSITQSWWTLPDPTTMGPLRDRGTWLNGWPSDIARCAFVWQMTGDRRFLNEPTNICQRASDAAIWCITNAWETRDIVNFQTENWYRGLPLIYDWLYHEFTPTQRSNVLYALERMSRFSLYGAYIFSVPVIDSRIDWTSANPLANYTNGFQVPSGCGVKHGANHPGILQVCTVYPALATYGEGTYGAEYLPMILNLSIARPHPQGSDESINAGRGYAYDGLFAMMGLKSHIGATITFPELALQKNPYWTSAAEWFSRIMPPGFYEANEPFGDLGSEAGYRSVWATRQVGRDLAAFLNDGRWLLHHKNQATYTPFNVSDAFWDLPTEFYFPLPEPATNSLLHRAFLKGGWVMGNSKPSNVADAYTDGVGYVLAARGSGHTGTGHDSPVDLNFQFWAYGVPVTESGYGMLGASKASWLHYTPAFNGLGVINYGAAPLVEAYSKIIAYTNAPDFTYACVDGRNAYPVFNTPVGGWVVDNAYAAMHSGGPARALLKARRHLLFMRNKYWVVFDDYAAQTNSTYSWIWQVPTQARDLAVDQADGSFTYLSTNGTRSIKVTAKSFNNPASMSLFDQRGWDVVKNPINGFSFKPEAVWSASGSALPAANASQYFSVVGPRQGYGFAWTNRMNFTWTTNAISANSTNIYTGRNIRESLTNFVQAVSRYFTAPAFQITWRDATNVVMTPPIDTLYHEYSAAYSPITVSYKAMITPRPAALWWNNASPSLSWQSAWVIYPEKAGQPDPVIQRLDNRTLSISGGGTTDVISFDPATSQPATLILDMAAVGMPLPVPGTTNRVGAPANPRTSD